jgi:hypothetical protein
MKKLLIVALMIAGSYGVANAKAQPKTVTQKTTSHVTTKNAVTTKTPAAPVVKMNSTKTTTAATTHTKADGTADKRYKENKTTTTKAVSAGPVKKDGTPDMRYKANKKH